jgi:putative ABC transport system permease protein
MAADRKIRNNVNGSKSGGAPGSKNMDAAGSRHTMTNRRMFFTMLFSAVFRRRSRAAMAVIAATVGSATLFCLAAVCIAVPQQMNEEMRAYGANLIVTPSSSNTTDASTASKATDAGENEQSQAHSESGITAEQAAGVTKLVKAQGAVTLAAYRYENVRINSSPYVLAGIDAKDVKTLNHHWNVDGTWPSNGNLMVGRDVANALGLEIGSEIKVAYRADDNGSAVSDSGSGTSDASGSANGSGTSTGNADADSTDGMSGTDSDSSTSSDMSDMDMSGMSGMSGMSQNSTGDTGSSSSPTSSSTPSSSSSAGSESASSISEASNNSSVTGTQGNNGRVSTDILDTEGTEFRIAGIVDTGGSEDEIIYATRSDLEALTSVKRGSDVIEYSSSAGDSALAALVKSINSDTANGVKAQQVTKIASSNTRIITMLQTLFWIVSLVVLALTLVGVGTTISSIVSQRRNEIGLRKALGASSRGIGMEFYAESAFYGVLGGVLGTAIGYGFARILSVSVFNRAIAFNWWLGVVSVLFTALIAVVASIPPVRKATKIDPAVVLREE